MHATRNETGLRNRDMFVKLSFRSELPCHMFSSRLSFWTHRVRGYTPTVDPGLAVTHKADLRKSGLFSLWRMSSGGRESRDWPGWEEMMTRKYPLTVAAVGLSILLSALLSASPAFMQQAGPGNKNILIICGDENGTTMLCTSIDDVTLKNRLEVSMGHRVKMMPHNVDATQMLAAANAADLVIIVESVNSATIGRKLVSTPTPILSSESFLQDEFGLV